jgi:hypothetical protein
MAVGAIPPPLFFELRRACWVSIGLIDCGRFDCSIGILGEKPKSRQH